MDMLPCFFLEKLMPDITNVLLSERENKQSIRHVLCISFLLDELMIMTGEMVYISINVDWLNCLRKIFVMLEMCSRLCITVLLVFNLYVYIQLFILLMIYCSFYSGKDILQKQKNVENPTQSRIFF